MGSKGSVTAGLCGILLLCGTVAALAEGTGMFEKGKDGVAIKRLAKRYARTGDQQYLEQLSERIGALKWRDAMEPPADGKQVILRYETKAGEQKVTLGRFNEGKWTGYAGIKKVTGWQPLPKA